MIDHLEALRAAGVDSLKIEGRMKSLYYVAMVARAYRHAIDYPAKLNPFREDLFAVSHREFSTGFYFGREEIETPAAPRYKQTHLFLGSVEEPPDGTLEAIPEGGTSGTRSGARPSWSRPAYLQVKNTISAHAPLELVSPAVAALPVEPGAFRLLDCEGNERIQLVNQSSGFIQIRRNPVTGPDPEPGWLLRRRL